MTQIIALSGFARCGKDVAAMVLAKEFGFKQIAFADKLREALYALNPMVSVWREWDLEPGVVRVQDVIDRYGWNGYKEGIYVDEIRTLLQKQGTEAGRDVLGKNVWVNAALDGLAEDAKVVLSDSRFYNEFDAVRALGGEVWRIERAGIGPLNDHPSEMEAIEYPHFKYTITNSTTLDHYKETVKQLYQISCEDKAIEAGG